jgi:ADP-heptose:LPS heptosyltransferase
MLSAQSEKVNRKRQGRALVLFPGSLGDFLCLLPTLHVIGCSAPEGENIVVRGELLEMARQLPFVSRAFSIDSGFFAQLFSSPPVVSREISPFFSSTTKIFSWFGHAYPEVKENLNLLAPGCVQSFAFFTGQEACHASTYYLRCVGIREIRCPSFVLGEKERRWLDRYWEIQEWQPSSRVFILHPGSGGKTKRWDPDGFIQVARWWQGHRRGKVLILIGPAEEQEEDFWRKIGVVEKNLSLLQVAALLSRADLYLGNDSGVSHLAGAVGARGVVLFGPTHPQQWRPLGGALSIMQNVAYRANMSYVSGISLTEIPLEAVLAELVRHGG